MDQNVKAGCLAVALSLAIFPAGCDKDAASQATSSDPATRLEGLQRLAAENTPQSVAIAVQAVQNEDVGTARAAVCALGKMPQQGGAAALAKVLAEDRRPAIRQEAALALSACPPEKAAEVLRETIEKDASPQVRSAAAIGMGRVGSLRDVEFLLRACEREPDPFVQYQTVGALEKILGIGFTFDPRLPEGRRRVTVERIRVAATIRAKVLRDQARTSRKGDTP